MIYKKACAVLQMPFDRRRDEIERWALSEELAEEVTRLYNQRKR